MTQANINTTTNSPATKGSHLTEAERYQIQAYHDANYSNRAIARKLNRSPQTINNEIHRGSVVQISKQTQNNKDYIYEKTVYFADSGQRIYEENRENCGRPSKWWSCPQFRDWADQKMLKNKWSPDAVTGYAREKNLFPAETLPCTTTLYDWIDRGWMKTKNIDLPLKVSRKPNQEKNTGTPPHQTHLGKSIDERPAEVAERNTFGHWEIDTVIGAKTRDDEVLLTLVERLSRFEILMKIGSKSAEAVERAILGLQEEFGDTFSVVFQSITADNGTEFASLAEAVQEVSEAYFAHPYSSFESRH